MLALLLVIAFVDEARTSFRSRPSYGDDETWYINEGSKRESLNQAQPRGRGRGRGRRAQSRDHKKYRDLTLPLSAQKSEGHESVRSASTRNSALYDNSHSALNETQDTSADVDDIHASESELLAKYIASNFGQYSETTTLGHIRDLDPEELQKARQMLHRFQVYLVLEIEMRRKIELFYMTGYIQ